LSTVEINGLHNNSNGRAYVDLSSSWPTTYTYDANGNMTIRVEARLTYNQTFDAENRLISVTVSGQTTQFIYDGDGNLVKKVKPDNSKTIYPSATPQKQRLRSGQAWVESTKWTRPLAAPSRAPS
jgi:YD repeat-containing protein